MAQITTKAIVLHARPYLDHHKLLTLFSPTHGRLTAVSHGCLSVKSKLRAASVPFASGEYVLSGKGERLSVASCQLDSDYYAAMTDYDAISHAAYLCQLCDAAVQEHQPNEALYTSLLRAMAHLNYGQGDCAGTFSAALLWMLDALGYAPELNRCASCGADKGRPHFSFAHGGLCCHRCAPQAPPIDRDALPFLRDARTGVIGDLSPNKAQALKLLLLDYCEYCIDRKLKAGELIR